MSCGNLPTFFEVCTCINRGGHILRCEAGVHCLLFSTDLYLLASRASCCRVVAANTCSINIRPKLYLRGSQYFKRGLLFCLSLALTRNGLCLKCWLPREAFFHLLFMHCYASGAVLVPIVSFQWRTNFSTALTNPLLFGLTALGRFRKYDLVFLSAERVALSWTGSLCDFVISMMRLRFHHKDLKRVC